MRRTLFAIALVGCIALVAVPASAAGPPDRVGHPPSQEVLDQSVSLLPCPEFIYVGEAEPFYIVHGWGLSQEELPGAGQYTFDVAVNGELLRPKYHNVVNPNSVGGTALTRFFVVGFSEGLVTGDVVEGFWYSPAGLEIYCMSTVVNGDPLG